MRQIELLMLASALTALAATVGLGAYTARKLPSVEVSSRSAELQPRRYGELRGERPVRAPRT